jgi:hypothetical protein
VSEFEDLKDDKLRSYAKEQMDLAPVISSAFGPWAFAKDRETIISGDELIKFADWCKSTSLACGGSPENGQMAYDNVIQSGFIRVVPHGSGFKFIYGEGKTQ